ncbi:unnamed protein product [Trifolium pratense]|uniref:Uncharacterized protein n=1 Tax=Trifolium pratense TaxID=57577 RepID=A0ACB0MBX1_TRIPR|nr:unnamed protein product [Trifolium pratense]
MMIWIIYKLSWSLNSRNLQFNIQREFSELKIGSEILQFKTRLWFNLPRCHELQFKPLSCFRFLYIDPI